MGMTSDQNENVSFAEQQEIKRREAARKAEEKHVPCFNPIAVINLNGKKYQLLVGEDKKWYKAEYIRSERADTKNRSPLIDIFSKEVSLFTEEEFNSYFYPDKVVKKKKRD